MAKNLDGRQTVPLDEVVLAQAFQLEALLNVLERQGVVWKAEVLEEIKRLSAKAVKALERHHWFWAASDCRNGRRFSNGHPDASCQRSP